MSKCNICLSDFYLGDEIDPPEPCWCEENHTGCLIDWRGIWMDGIENLKDNLKHYWIERDIFRKFIVYRLAIFLYKIADKLTHSPERAN